MEKISIIFCDDSVSTVQEGRNIATRNLAASPVPYETIPLHHTMDVFDYMVDRDHADGVILLTGNNANLSMSGPRLLQKLYEHDLLPPHTALWTTLAPLPFMMTIQGLGLADQGVAHIDKAVGGVGLFIRDAMAAYNRGNPIPFTRDTIVPLTRHIKLA